MGAGEPMVGDSRFAAWLNARIDPLRRANKLIAVRVVNDKDLVPCFPGKFVGFSHVAKPCLLTSKPEFLVLPDIDEVKDVGDISAAADDHEAADYHSAFTQACRDELASRHYVIDPSTRICGCYS